jgi:tRNA nucleotidyltransferase (CCA-adding enzyme)
VDGTSPEVLQALRGLPGGSSVLDVSARIPGLWLVGGAVRDVLLGATVRDLDLAVEGDLDAVVGALGASIEDHVRFGTATVETPDGGVVNVARTRTETYARPGALPDVRPAGIDEDLARRDFTVNAMAVGLPSGELRAVPNASEDLRSRVLRVLHPRSFEDDPTRLLRLARYVSRLGFSVEPETAALASRGSLETVSGDRVGGEVRLLLAEPDPVRALAAGAKWGGGPVKEADPELAAVELPPDGRRDLLLLAAAGMDARALGFTAEESARVEAARDAASLAEVLGAASRPSEIASAVRGWPVEAVALAGALGARDQARAWLSGLRDVRLSITGHDLLAAGVPEGPEVGRRLAAALAQRLDGELEPGAEAELRAALAA